MCEVTEVLKELRCLKEESRRYEDRLFHWLTESGQVLSASVQGFSHWHAERSTRLTSSCFGVILGVSEWANQRALWDRLVSKQQDLEQNEDMARGVRLEGVARRWYERTQKVKVQETGLWVCQKKSFLGASPDGLVGDDGLLEIKCPRRQPHDCIPPDYLAQVQGQLLVTRRKWCDFLSFTVDHGKRIWRIHASEAFWEWMLPTLETFYMCVELEEPPAPECHNRKERALFAQSLCHIQRIL